jgi:multiple sugar transport system ATP-binding protein
MGQITLNDVTKRYDNSQIVAVNDLSLSIRNSEFLVLLGPSGCGKSTTLRMVSGLETVTEGDILIGDEVVNDLEPRERDIAMVFQNYALYPHMTVEENMGFGLQLSTDMSDDEITSRVRDAAEMMDIADLLDQKPKQLSGGQQQRVALGRSIVREPEAFLFDEPLSNLDAKLRSHMRTELTRLQHELGVTSLYVTHDQAEAMTMGDRIAIMNDGKLQQIDEPTTIFDHPTNQFVAEFIGEPSMNTLDRVEYRADEDTGRVVDVADRGGFEFPLASATAESLPVAAGDRLSLGVRPEDITVNTDLADRSPHEFAATVDVVETMGSDQHVYVEFLGEIWTARTGRVDLTDRDEVTIGFSEEAIHLFDSEGRTLKSRGTDSVAYHFSKNETKELVQSK